LIAPSHHQGSDEYKSSPSVDNRVHGANRFFRGINVHPIHQASRSSSERGRSANCGGNAGSNAQLRKMKYQTNKIKQKRKRPRADRDISQQRMKRMPSHDPLRNNLMGRSGVVWKHRFKMLSIGR